MAIRFPSRNVYVMPGIKRIHKKVVFETYTSCFGYTIYTEIDQGGGVKTH